MMPRKPPATFLRAVVYTRLSNFRGDADPSTSPARQRESCSAYALAKGWQVVDVVEDLDVSGSDKGLRLNRPGLLKVRELLPTIDVVIFAKLDRLARSVVDFRAFAEEAEGYDVALVSVAESLDLTTPSGRFVATILSAFAEMEAATISQRTLDGKAGAIALRRHANGAAPYGYRTVPHSSGVGRGLDIAAEEAAHIRAAADFVLSGGSLYGALALMRERGSVPRRASAWSISSLRVVLTGPSVLGHMTHRGSLLRDEDGLPLQVWPHVLPVEDVERLRAILARKPVGERRKRATRVLSGLLSCSSCGSTLRVSSSRVGGKTVLRYACRGDVDGRACAHPVSIVADLVEEHVTSTFLATSGDLDVMEEVRTSRDVAGLAAVESAITDLGRQITEPGADIPALAIQLATLHGRRDDLAGQEVTVEARPTGRTFRETWEAADIDGRRALLRSGLAAAVIRPGKRGRHGLDPSRVALIYAAPLTSHHEAIRPGALVVPSSFEEVDAGG